ncbi:TonB-dependent siderophore receptor [Marinobacter mobilis]|uniref:Outer-membrane receptor for ferric coprogen and ferric-rhodotorulic acid n=1 Tax=Marinobacter mobilis TaxID=488533 RepID=A0A1H2ZV77_9GAMM|nr:TonB-dependent siderophore receptor [Marinobacter mobilis]SDX21265.1 outer-membrane receptor for ferric coprogen and ferric-rhodotorulic acid [Marinobacter mobilis]
MSHRLIPVFRRSRLASAIVLVTLPVLSMAEEVISLDAIDVSGQLSEPSSESTGSYTVGSTRTATKLDLAPRETPQAVSVATRQQMDDFGQDDINSVLDSTTGVTVERAETDRTYYTARGFDITNFQYDGVGLPMVYGNVLGKIDTAFFDRVEVLRGANGLMSGVGNPSATVNFIRKRPTARTQASITATGGSHDYGRLVGDLSGALSESGHVRGRLVVGGEGSESYLDRYETTRQMLYGVIEADVTDTTLLTLGHFTQTSDADSPMWGSLPLLYSDGTQTDYPRSTSTSADWAYWNSRYHNSFLTLSQELAGGWQAQLSVTRLEIDSDSKLFYQYGTPDRNTGLGLAAYPSLYTLEKEQWIADLYASGPFSLAGRTHELVVGGNWSYSELDDISYYGQGIGTPLPPLEQWTGHYPEPAFDAAVNGSDWTDKYISSYAAARWSLTDRLSAITGLRMTWLDSHGTNYGNSKDTSYDAVETPYAGVLYDLNDQHTVYVSYTEIFSPQTETDVAGDRLDPIDGVNYELGLKSELLDRQLQTTVALFHTEQDNLAELAGKDANGEDYYQGADGITSDGIELEATGAIGDRIQLTAGYTYVDIEDADNNAARTFVPEHLVRAKGTYDVPAFYGLKVGALVRWQSEISAAVGNAEVKQDSYALVDLMANYEFTDNWSTTLNLYNVTDEKYLASLYWGGSQSYYGEPVSADLTVKWTY